MKIDLGDLQLGQSYDRPYLAQLWGYESHQAISRGVVTPAATNYIILFVTKEKQKALPQYNDFLDGNLLFWEGEEKHSTDDRVIHAKEQNVEIHLFYRELHHSPFVYFGPLNLLDFQLKKDKPSEFIFNLTLLASEVDVVTDVREHAAEYAILPKTEQESVVLSRMVQGTFRQKLIRLWGSCSLTGFHTITLLRASHIKPWKDSTNTERLNPYNDLLLIPNYDLLFDQGLISFRSSGEIIISNRLGSSDKSEFRVANEMKLRKTYDENKAFLEYHREVIFR